MQRPLQYATGSESVKCVNPDVKTVFKKLDPYEYGQDESPQCAIQANVFSNC